jgi:RNA polymerase sigma-70 factor (ECF subfamily)
MVARSESFAMDESPPPPPTGPIDVDHLESFRGYLCAVAEREIHPRWRARLAASDLVQQTLIEAAQALPQAELQDPHEVARWLRRILSNNMCDSLRKLNAACRDVGREVTTGKSMVLRRLVARVSESPPSQAIRREESNSLDEAITRLPIKYQQVILWRHREDCSFAHIAESLGISENAAHKLWTRAIDALRDRLKSSP